MNDSISLFLGGDVMTGRAVDQILSHPGNPALFEPTAKSATFYLDLAESLNGPIARPVSNAYVWGDAMEEWRYRMPDLRIINLETAVTTSDDRLDKLVNYRMNPANLGCLTAAGIDCCVLANNHVLDWGRSGLLDTLGVLRPRMQIAGAGEDQEQASTPAVINVAGRRVLVLSAGVESSGIPPDWGATRERSGIWFLDDLSSATVTRVVSRINQFRRPGDIVVFSIHWGPNWVKRIPRLHRNFARALIDSESVDLVHGHSSHHPLGLEIYRGRLILYGCGDFINDYEGISRYRKYRNDLCLMYFPTLSADGRLLHCSLVPLQMRKFSLHRASRTDADWLRRKLARQSTGFRTRFRPSGRGDLKLSW